MIPKIRNKNYKDSWVVQELDELVDKAVDNRGFTPKYKKDGKHPLIEVACLENDILNYDKVIKYFDDDTFNNLLRGHLKENDILFSTVGSIGEIALMDKNEDAAIAQNIIALRNKENSNPFFIYALLLNRNNKRIVNNIVMNAVQPSIKVTQLLKCKYNITKNLQEQKKIGIFIFKLQFLINQESERLAKIRKIKKSFLQRMFPARDFKIPELRFKGFDEEWKLGTINDFGYFYYGKSAPKWSVTQDAKTPCIRYGEMYTKFGEKIDKVHSYTSIDSKKLRFSNGTEVLIPRVGEDPNDYNHCTWLSLKNVAIGEMISVYNTKQNPLFTAIMFNALLKYEFAKRVEGGTVTNLYYEKLKNIEISFPSLEEQKMIASFFDNFNKLIQKYEQKIQILKQLKQSFLQNMFV